MDSLDIFAREKVAQIEARGLRRGLVETDRYSETGARRDGQDLISFCCNDYLNLSHHPAVIEAAKDATDRFGTGAGASRLITGNTPLYTELERKLAALKQTDDAIVFGSGYLTNIGVIPGLVGPDDLIIADELNHACLVAGARLSRAAVHLYAHGDASDCEALLRKHRAKHDRCMILTDGVFSMDGDIAPLAQLASMAREYDAWLLTDDAHGLGVLGGGRGSSFLDGQKEDIPLQMGTLSKAVGSYGGYLCASQPVIDLLRNRARSFVYSTGLPPGTIAAATKALEIIEADEALCAKPLANAKTFCRDLNLREPQTNIVPLILGQTERVMDASHALAARGYLVTGIRPPTVPEGTARLRFTFSAAHSEKDVRALASAVRGLGLEPFQEKALTA